MKMEMFSQKAMPKKLIIKDTHKNSRRSKQIKVSIPAGREFKRMEFSVEAWYHRDRFRFKTETFVAEIGAGEFYCEGEIRAEECTLDVGAGSIETERITAKKISGDCGTGEIDMELAGKKVVMTMSCPVESARLT